MSEMDIARVLADMRALAAQASNSPEAAAQPGQADFSDLLKQSIDSVNETQATAKAAAESFEAGDPAADLTEVMIALKKADVSFKAMTEVRNKLVDAYREIMNMPI